MNAVCGSELNEFFLKSRKRDSNREFIKIGAFQEVC